MKIPFRTKEQKDAKEQQREAEMVASLSPDEQILYNKNLPKAQRKEAYERVKQAFMNPRANFNAQTFDPFDDGSDVYEVQKRTRQDPPRRLPTMGLKPKEIMEGQMIGMYESKQDLYLLIAHLSERVATLEDKLTQHGIV